MLHEYNGNIPFEFHPDNLPSLTEHQVVFFDEIHIDQEAGSISKTGVQIRFPRDKEGKYAPKSESNPNPIYTKIQHKPSFKYTAQGRFCIGVAAIKLANGVTIGKISMVYDYSCKRLISIKEFKRRLDAEIKRVKNLTSTHARNK